MSLGFWWSLANGRYYEDGREGEESREVHFSPVLSLPSHYWLAVVSPSKNKAPVRHFFQSVSHPCPSGLVVVRDSSLWCTAIALVFLKQRSSKHSSETPRGPAPLSGTGWGQIYHPSRWGQDVSDIFHNEWSAQVNMQLYLLNQALKRVAKHATVQLYH